MGRLVEEVKKGNEAIEKRNKDIRKLKMNMQKMDEILPLLIEALSNRLQVKKEEIELREELSLLINKLGEELELASNRAQSILLNGTDKDHINEWQSIIDANTELKNGNSNSALKLLKSTKKFGVDFANSLKYNLLFEVMKALVFGS
jgi:hypothetical protein